MKKNISRISFIVHQNEIFTHTDDFLFGISGGQDSLLNLIIFYHLQNVYTFKITLIYCNHFWQKKNFYGNFEVFKLAYLIEFPLTINASNKILLNETNCRDWRQSSFCKLTQYYSSPFLVLGHTASDQLETALWHFLRGTSPKGFISLNQEKIFYFPLCLNQITKKSILKSNQSKNKFVLKQSFPATKYYQDGILSKSESYILEKLTTLQHSFKNYFSLQISRKKINNFTKIKNTFETNSYLFLLTLEQTKEYKVKRPLLNFSRPTIAQIIHENNLPLNYDITNLNLKYSRNKIRLLLLPLLNYYFEKDSEKQIKKYINTTYEEQQYFNFLIKKIFYFYWLQPQEISFLKKIPKTLSSQILFKLLENYCKKQGKQTHLNILKNYLFNTNFYR